MWINSSWQCYISMTVNRLVGCFSYGQCFIHILREILSLFLLISETFVSLLLYYWCISINADSLCFSTTFKLHLNLSWWFCRDSSFQAYRWSSLHLHVCSILYRIVFRPSNITFSLILHTWNSADSHILERLLIAFVPWGDRAMCIFSWNANNPHIKRSTLQLVANSLTLTPLKTLGIPAWWSRFVASGAVLILRNYLRIHLIRLDVGGPYSYWVSSLSWSCSMCSHNYKPFSFFIDCQA